MRILILIAALLSGEFDVKVQVTGFEASFGTGELILTEDSTELIISGEWIVSGNTANPEQSLEPFIGDWYYSGGVLQDRTPLDLLAFYQGWRMVGDESWEVMGGMNGPGSIDYEELRYLTVEGDIATFAFDQSLQGHLMVAPQIHYVKIVIPAQTVLLSNGLNTFPISPEPSTLILSLLGILMSFCVRR